MFLPLHETYKIVRSLSIHILYLLFGNLLMLSIFFLVCLASARMAGPDNRQKRGHHNFQR